jgi:hypothetical protein
LWHRFFSSPEGEEEPQILRETSEDERDCGYEHCVSNIQERYIQDPSHLPDSLVLNLMVVLTF